MKNLFAVLFLFCASLFVSAQSTTPRWGTGVNNDNTGRILTSKDAAITYASTVTVIPSASNQYYSADSVSGSMTINATTTLSYKYDRLVIKASGKAGGSRVITFGTGFIANGTLTAAATKRVTITFIFDGGNFVETSRFVQP